MLYYKNWLTDTCANDNTILAYVTEKKESFQTIILFNLQVQPDESIGHIIPKMYTPSSFVSVVQHKLPDKYNR